MAGRLKGICERYSFPTKFKQRIVSYWTVLSKHTNNNGYVAKETHLCPKEATSPFMDVVKTGHVTKPAVKKAQNNVGNAALNRLNKKDNYIYLSLQYIRAPDHSLGELVFLSFNTHTKIHVLADKDLLAYFNKKYKHPSHAQIIALLREEPMPVTIYQDMKLSAHLSN